MYLNKSSFIKRHGNFIKATIQFTCASCGINTFPMEDRKSTIARRTWSGGCSWSRDDCSANTWRRQTPAKPHQTHCRWKLCRLTFKSKHMEFRNLKEVCCTSNKTGQDKAAGCILERNEHALYIHLSQLSYRGKGFSKAVLNKMPCAWFKGQENNQGRLFPYWEKARPWNNSFEISTNHKELGFHVVNYS